MPANRAIRFLSPGIGSRGLTDDEFPPAPPKSPRNCTRRAQALNRLVAAAFATPPVSLRDMVERYGRLFVRVDRRWRKVAGEKGAL